VSGGASRIGNARLTVLLDVRHPHAYLALHPAEAFGRAQGASIDWLPIEVPALRAPSSPAADDDRGIRHRRARAQAIARGIEAYAEAQGLVLRDYYREPDVRAFNGAFLWLRREHPARLFQFLAEGFRRYWSVELEPGDVEAVAGLLAALGIDAAGYREFMEAEGPAALDAHAAELAGRGIAATPGYLVEDEFFEGRQHLPMIRWILEGRVGPGPI